MEAYAFPVELQSVVAANGQLIPKTKAVVRKDTGLPLSVVSDRYHLFTHQEAVEKTEGFLKTFGDYKVSNVLSASSESVRSRTRTSMFGV